MMGLLNRIAGRATSLTRRYLRRPKVGGVSTASTGAVAAYWTRHNVTGHRVFRTIDESLDYFHWRSGQYFDYLDLMPVSGADGKVVLDFGCGPGNDLVGFGVYSKPRLLIGADVSRSSLEQARSRLALHNILADLVHLGSPSLVLPLESGSVDYIHTSGVLHHVPDIKQTFAELRRVLRPSGTMRVMVYNYSSVWLHLYVAYVRQIAEQVDSGLDVRQAFARSTDGPDCPIAEAYTPQEFCQLAESCGFTATYLGAAISAWELKLLPRRFEAIMTEKLGREHRDFLAALTFDRRGVPFHGDSCAGIDACFLLRPR